MATRKQRARRAKTFRHDYGFVVADEEGNEVEVSGADVRAKGKNEGAAGQRKPGSKAAPKRASATREPPAPSWNRALKRGLPWGLAAGLGLSFISHTSILVGVVYAAAFVPLMYWTDAFMYRRFQRRKPGGPAGKPS
jgi:hypothetical protein